MPFIEPLTLDAWNREIQDQIEQIQALHSDLCAAEALAAEDHAMIAQLEGENAILEAENARLREALKFYANPDHWEPPYANPGENPFSVMDDDEGKTARAALKET